MRPCRPGALQGAPTLLVTVLALALAAAAAPAEGIRFPAAAALHPVPPPEPTAARLGGAARVSKIALPADQPAPAPGERFGPLGLTCASGLSLRAAAGASLQIRLNAPCSPNARVVLRHEGLEASYLASSSGRVEAVFPALAERARVEAEFENGDTLTAEIRVPGAAGFDRVAVMSRAGADVAIHAFEYGARQGGAGHVWHGAPRGPEVADAGRGGYLLRLGDRHDPAALRAEVYSFPAAQAQRAGTVRIALGAAVDAASCGRALEAVTLQVGADLPAAPVALRLDMPGCDRQGDYVLLKNLARDLRIESD